ncbi:MAG: hypothetical protein J7621_20445 [Niastella sp.]|nr:hypothetical protein [Niastella sp.]
MARIHPLTEEQTQGDIKKAFESHVVEHNARITNMKGTLGHSKLSFEVYMQWYPLYEKVQQLVGNRTAYLYAWSVSTASNCPLCSTFFRRIIKEAGESPEHLVLNEYETTLLDFGSAVAMHKGCIADHIYNKLAGYHNDAEMVLLIAFAGQMIATNIFNNVVETEIDDYLVPYLPAKYAYVPTGK